jgi:hypothetical protein
MTLEMQNEQEHSLVCQWEIALPDSWDHDIIIWQAVKDRWAAAYMVLNQQVYHIHVICTNSSMKGRSAICVTYRIRILQAWSYYWLMFYIKQKINNRDTIQVYLNQLTWILSFVVQMKFKDNGGD